MLDLILKEPICITIASVEFTLLGLRNRFIDSTLPSHFHGTNCYEVHYIIQGRGFTIINNERYELTPGTFIITGPQVEHSQVAYKDSPITKYCVFFSISTKLIKKGMYFDEMSSIISFLKETPIWVGKGSQAIYEDIKQLINCCFIKNYGYMLETNSIFTNFLLDIMRCCSDKMPSKTENLRKIYTDAYYSRVIESMFLSYFSSVTLKDLADKINLSERQTERVLLRLYNKSFCELKLLNRMEAAKKLLITTSKSINEIAILLGYSTAECFSTAFKKYYDKSPTQYRKANIIVSESES